MKRVTPGTPFKALGSHEEDILYVRHKCNRSEMNDVGYDTYELIQTQTPERYRHQHLHQSLTMQTIQVNQVDPKQLESLLENRSSAVEGI